MSLFVLGGTYISNSFSSIFRGNKVSKCIHESRTKKGHICISRQSGRKAVLYLQDKCIILMYSLNGIIKTIDAVAV